MTTYVVASLLDDGSAGTLRYELARAESGDTVTFDPSLAGGTITLNSTLTVADGVNIDGTGESIAISSANGDLKNNGLIDAASGLLTIDGNVSGSGLLQIETGATLKLDGTTGESVTFDGINAALELGPSSSIGSLYNLGGGDMIDLVGVDLTAVSFGTNELIGTLAGGGKLTLSTPGVDSSLQLSLVSDSSGSTISLLPSPVSAVPEITTSLGEYNSIVLPDAHVAAGQFDEENLAIANTAMAPADGLTVGIGLTTGDAYGNGAITSLAPGATNNTGIAVGLDDTGAGAKSGTVALIFQTDGSVSGVNAQLGTETINLTGDVYRLATASITAPVMILHVGDGGGSETELLTVANTDPADGYSEGLEVTAIAGVGGDVTGATGTTGDIAAGSSDSSSLSVTISTTGAVSGGTVAVSETSDGTGIDTLGTTALGTIDVPVNIAVDNYANPVVQQAGGSATLSQVGDTYTLNFGTVYQGEDVSDNLDVANDVTGPSDWLTGTVSANGDAAFSDTGLGAFGPLSAGDTTPLSIDFNPQSPGVFTQTITVAETDSNAGGFDQVLNGQTIVVTGTAYGPATASLSAAPVYVHKGDDGGSVTLPIMISNTAPANGYAENLDAQIVNFGTYVTSASGSVTDLAPGKSNDTLLWATLSDPNIGTYSGEVEIALHSDGTGIDSEGTTSLGNAYVQATLVVDNYASPAIQQANGSAALSQVGDTYTLDFGTVSAGQGQIVDTLDVANAVSGPADWLSGILSASGDAAFSDTGLGAYGPLSAGGTAPISIDLDTTDSGTFSEIITLSATDSNPSGYDAALSGLTIDVTGTVVPNPAIQQAGGSATLSQVGDTYTLNFGTVYQGEDVSDNLDVANDVTGPSDWLTGTVSANGDAAFSDTGLGAFGPLSAGDTTPLSIDFNPQSPGVFTQTITVAETDSNAGGFDQVLNGQTIVVTGTAYGPATASLSAAPVYVHKGDDGGSVTLPIMISNTAPANGYAENLDAQIVNFGTYVTSASGSVTDLAPGKSNDTLLWATLSDPNIGTYSGEVEIALHSDGTGIDSEGTTSLGNAYVQATLVVDNYASPAIQQANGSAALSQVGDTYTLDFGTVSAGQGQIVDTLDVANAVSGPADWLSGILSASGDAAFSDTGLGAYGPLSAGGTAPISIDLDTTDSGTFNQTITLTATDSNPSGYDAALSGLTIDVTGTVVPCFCCDTLILTDQGEVPVQNLSVGDKIITMAGPARPIKWIGRRSYSGRFVMGRKDILPVCIKAGALGDSVPARDLWISPHHAMYFKENHVEGVLIEAKDLLNGVSIVQAERVGKVEYFHIELECHDVIIADGALSETFIDDDSRGMFHNAHEYRTLHPDAATVLAQYCAPRLNDGYEVEAARRRIALRAGLLRDADSPQVGPLRGFVDAVSQHCIKGWAQSPHYPEVAVCLDIYAGDRLIGQTLANSYREDLKRAGVGSGHHAFAFTLPPGLAVGTDSMQVRRSLDGSVVKFSAVARRALQQSLKETHNTPGLFQRVGEFPTRTDPEFPMAEAAVDFYKNGPSFLDQYVPFWITNYAKRIFALLATVIVIVLPLFSYAPKLYRWLRLGSMYRRLRVIEANSQKCASPSEVSALEAELESVDREIHLLGVPMQHSVLLFSIKSHLDDVRAHLGSSRAKLLSHGVKAA